MTITNVAWVRDHRRQPVLELDIDGHPAHIPSGQRSELLRRGIVEGIVFLASQRSSQLPNAFVRGQYGPELPERALIGCTDDPRVFALYEEMCRSIRVDAWQPGPRALPV